MFKEYLLSDYEEHLDSIFRALKLYKKRTQTHSVGFIYPSAETFLESCTDCDVCVVYDNYFIVAEVGCQWWDKDTPVLFECLVLSIGKHDQECSFVDAIDHFKELFGCKYISFGTQSMQSRALGKVLEDNGYVPYGGFYCKE